MSDLTGLETFTIQELVNELKKRSRTLAICLDTEREEGWCDFTDKEGYESDVIGMTKCLLIKLETDYKEGIRERSGHEKIRRAPSQKRCRTDVSSGQELHPYQFAGQYGPA